MICVKVCYWIEKKTERLANLMHIDIVGTLKCSTWRAHSSKVIDPVSPYRMKTGKGSSSGRSVKTTYAALRRLVRRRQWPSQSRWRWMMSLWSHESPTFFTFFSFNPLLAFEAIPCVRKAWILPLENFFRLIRDPDHPTIGKVTVCTNTHLPLMLTCPQSFLRENCPACPRTVNRCSAMVITNGNTFLASIRVEGYHRKPLTSPWRWSAACELHWRWPPGHSHRLHGEWMSGQSGRCRSQQSATGGVPGPLSHSWGDDVTTRRQGHSGFVACLDYHCGCSSHGDSGALCYVVWFDDGAFLCPRFAFDDFSG